MKYYRELNDYLFSSGGQPHKSSDRKNSGKTKKFNSFKKDEDSLDAFSKVRSSYKRSENKNMMRSQLRETQIVF